MPPGSFSVQVELASPVDTTDGADGAAETDGAADADAETGGDGAAETGGDGAADADADGAAAWARAAKVKSSSSSGARVTGESCALGARTSRAAA